MIINDEIQPCPDCNNLNNSRELFTVSENIVDYTFLINLSKKIVIPSPSISNIYFNDTSDIHNAYDQFMKLINVDNWELFSKSVSSVLSTPTKPQSMNICINYNERIQWMLLRLSTISSPQYEGYVACLMFENEELTDLYEKQKGDVYEELKKAQMINNLIIDGASDYVYQLDLVKNRCTFSPHAVEVLPLDNPTFDNAMEKVLSFIVPEDRMIFMDSMGDYLAGKSQYHTAEYRVLTRTGEIMWISCKGKGIHDKDGNPLIIAGSLLDITDKKNYEKYIEDMVNLDQLTGLFSRYRFDNDMVKAINSIDNNTGAVLFLDIDNFKVFNDLFGHNFGNKILIHLASLMKRHLPDNAIIYRLSGDEFVVLWPNAKQEIINNYMNPLMEELRSPLRLEENTVYVTFSIGVAFYPAHGKTTDDILKSADIAMYAAKRSSKNNLSFYVDCENNDMSRHFILETELRTSINNNFIGFSVFYQPIVDTLSGNWKGAEALLRWVSPTFGMVPTDDVIEILEYIGDMAKVGTWVLGMAIEECALWHNLGFYNAFVNVNLSIVQLDDPYLYNEVITVLNKFNLSPKYLCFEFTETLLIKNFSSAMSFCQAMQKLGIYIALDDFGTGYSSLSYLRKLPLNQIKIDKSFLVDFDKDEYNRLIVSTVCSLAHSINMTVCVEGVEEPIQWDILKTLNVDSLQGYFFGRPMKAESFRELFLAKAL